MLADEIHCLFPSAFHGNWRNSGLRHYEHSRTFAGGERGEDGNHCGRGSNSASSFARHSPSMIPSIRSGRKRRWKAITAFCASVTS